MLELLIIKISVCIIMVQALLILLRNAFGLEKSKVFSCGIYGFSLKPDGNKKAALMKLKLLGIYNIPRGKDSCGVFIDGKITKGVGPTKMFDDFIENEILDVPQENLVALGHNRWSTKGANTESNAHPFLINNKLVGVHNGTISNVEELCLKYELNHKDFQVDSQALYTLLDNEGPEVLNFYKGFAALAYTYPNDPNTLYLYHGASKSYKLGPEVEERPLFYLETEDGLFFSSLSESLYAIRDKEEEVVYILNPNIIYQITEGEFTELEIAVDRGTSNIFVPVTNLNSNVGKHYRPADNRANLIGTSNLLETSKEKKIITDTNRNVDEYIEPLILRETLPVKVLENKNNEKFVYYHVGRHWMYPRTVCEGALCLSSKGGYLQKDVNDKANEIFYFHNGVLLEDKKTYDVIMELKANQNSFINDNKDLNYASLMSKYTCWPITNNIREAANLPSRIKSSWWHNGIKTKTLSFTPKFSGRNYIIEDGYLSGIKSSHKEETLFNGYSAGCAQVSFLLTKSANVPGGNVSKESFPSDNTSPFKGSSERIDFNASYEARNNTTEFTNEEETSGWYYETVFPTLEAAYDVIGNVEIEALKNYVRAYKSMTDPLEPDEKEVDEYTFDLIFNSVNSKKAIIEFCENERDAFTLKNEYDKLLAKLDVASYQGTDYEEEPDDKSVYGTYEETVNSTFSEIADYNNNVNEFSNEKMRVVDTTDDILGHVEDLLNIASELEVDKQDEYAEDIAFIIRRDIGNLTTSLKIAADTFNDEELDKKLDKIKEKHLTL